MKFFSVLFVFILFGCGGSKSSDDSSNTAINYDITSFLEGGGKITPSKVNIISGKSATFELLPDEGYFLSSVKGCDGVLTTNYLVTNVIGDCEITVVFIKNNESLAPKAEIIFPAKQAKTEQSAITVKGLATSLEPIKSIFVNGVEAEILSNIEANNNVSWQVNVELKESSLNQLTVKSISESGHSNKTAAVAQLSNIAVPNSFTVDNINKRFIGRTTQGLQLIDLTNGDSVFKVSSQYSQEGDWACCANEITYNNYSNTLIFTTLFDNELSFFSQNVQSAKISNLSKVNLALEPNIWSFAAVTDIEYDFISNSVFISITYHHKDDYYANELVLYKYDLETFEFNLIKTIGFTFEEDFSNGQFSLLDSNVYYLQAAKNIIQLDISTQYEAPIGQTLSNPAVTNVDVNSNSGELIFTGLRGIGSFNLITQEQQVFQTGGNELDFVQIRNTAIDESTNRLFIGDSGLDMILQFDLTSDLLEPYLMNGVGTGKRMIGPRDITLDKTNNRIYVLDDGDNAPGFILSVELSTGNRTQIREGVVSGDVLIDEENQLLYILSPNSISRINLATNEEESISSNSLENSGELFESASGFSLDRKNNRLLVSDRERSSLFSVDISTGFRSVIAEGFGPNDMGTSSAVDVKFDNLNNKAYVLSQSLASIFSVDITTGEKAIILNNCLSSFNEQVLNEEDWGLQSLFFDSENRNLYAATGESVLKFNVDTKECSAPRKGDYSSFFDIVVTEKGQLIGSYFNSLNQFDFESEERVIISK